MAFKIAIVEDDVDQQQNYADSLNRKGFETFCYADVHEALQGISAVKPDLVLLDVVLGMIRMAALRSVESYSIAGLICLSCF